MWFKCRLVAPCRKQTTWWLEKEYWWLEKEPWWLDEEPWTNTWTLVSRAPGPLRHSLWEHFIISWSPHPFVLLCVIMCYYVFNMRLCVNHGGWERLSSAAPATDRAAITTISRQHRPKYLGNHHRDIHLIEIKYCEDTRSWNQSRPAQYSTNISAPSFKEPPHQPFGCGWHHLQLWSLSRYWVLTLNRHDTCIRAPWAFCQAATLPNLSILDAHH